MQSYTYTACHLRPHLGALSQAGRINLRPRGVRQRLCNGAMFFAPRWRSGMIVEHDGQRTYEMMRDAKIWYNAMGCDWRDVTRWDQMRYDKTLRRDKTLWDMARPDETWWDRVRHGTTWWDVMRHDDTAWDVMRQDEKWNDEASWNIIYDTQWDMMRNDRMRWLRMG